MNRLDYSQVSLWNFCPWAWYERYVHQRTLRYTGQRSDPLCLGSLVHNGLDNFAKDGRPSFDEPTVVENNPTPETLQLAQILVEGYLKKYPAELWPVELAEQPLQFPLGFSVQRAYTDGRIGYEMVPVNALAKLDGYFYVPEDTTIESGLDGYTLTLSRGWWAKEYKTKAHGRNRAEWCKEWQTKRQADFQIMALQELLRKADVANIGEEGKYHDLVQGVLVCVLEKPYEYRPIRKCKGCHESYDMMMYIPRSDGFMCPMCSHVQELKPYKPTKAKEPEYFRLTVVRNADQLAVAKEEITATALAMEAMREQGMSYRSPNRDACVNNVHRRSCEYLDPHTYGGSTATNPNFVQVDAYKYMGVAA